MIYYQKVLLQLYICLPTLTTSTPLKPWLLQVAKNRCIDEQPKRRRRSVTRFSEQEWNADEELSLLAMLPQPLPQEWVEDLNLEQALHQAIEALPETMRSVMLLRCTDYLPFSKTGEALHMPEATAKISFQWARKQLRTALVTQ
jgi:RNA polymerase sigma-70 factor, ECF subfamily